MAFNNSNNGGRFQRRGNAPQQAKTQWWQYKIGGLWPTKANNGNFTGSIELNGQKFLLAVFENNSEKQTEKSPSHNIYISPNDPASGGVVQQNVARSQQNGQSNQRSGGGGGRYQQRSSNRPAPRNFQRQNQNPVQEEQVDFADNQQDYEQNHVF